MEAIYEHMYETLNDLLETEDEKKLRQETRFGEEKNKVQKNKPINENQKTGMQQMWGTQLIQTSRMPCQKKHNDQNAANLGTSSNIAVQHEKTSLTKEKTNSVEDDDWRPDRKHFRLQKTHSVGTNTKNGSTL